MKVAQFTQCNGRSTAKNFTLCHTHSTALDCSSNSVNGWSLALARNPGLGLILPVTTLTKNLHTHCTKSNLALFSSSFLLYMNIKRNI